MQYLRRKLWESIKKIIYRILVYDNYGKVEENKNIVSKK